MAQGLTIDQISVGQSHRKTVLMTEEMMITFTRAVGDSVSFHQDFEMAKESFFGRMVAPGMLTASLIGLVLGTEFPGLGTVYVSQEVKFKKPVYHGDELTVEVEVVEVQRARNRVRLKNTIYNQNRETVLTGEAEIMPPSDKDLGAKT